MATAQAIEICSVAWGDKRGYVVLSLRDPTKQNTEPGYWADKAFDWPGERTRVKAFIERASHSHKDLYWAPAVFRTPHRNESKALKLDTLYADLDEVDPSKLPKHLQPTASWETSPGRYQALWSLDHLVSPSQHNDLNQRLTYTVGADKGGWGLTKVLRLPGTLNHKYDPTPEVRLINLNGHVLKVGTITKDLPEVTHAAKPNGSQPDNEAIPNPAEVLRRRSIPARAKRILASRHVVAHTRSDRLWELECLLAESGLTAPEIVSLVRGSVWNKYQGRGDELRRLATEAAKAIGHVGLPSQLPNRTTPRTLTPGIASRPIASQPNVGTDDQSDDALEDQLDEDAVEGPRRWVDFDRQRTPISWLVAEVWGESEVGFISGPPKTFKSWISLDMAISVATGTPFLNTYQTRRRNVLLIQEEDPQAVLQTRMSQIAGVKDYIYAEMQPSGIIEMRYELPDNLYVLSNQGFVVNEDWLDLLQQWIYDRKIGLVVMDPLSMIAGEVDEFKMFELMTKLLKPLKQVRAETQAAICIVHHHTKVDTGKVGGAAMYGSVAFWAWEEAAMHLSLIGPTRVSAERFSKHDQLTPITIELGDTSNTWDPQVSKGSHGSIEDLLTSMEGATIEEVVNYTGMGRDAVTRHMKKYEVEGQVIKESAPRGGPGRPAARYHWVKTGDD